MDSLSVACKCLFSSTLFPPLRIVTGRWGWRGLCVTYWASLLVHNYPFAGHSVIRLRKTLFLDTNCNRSLSFFRKSTKILRRHYEIWLPNLAHWVRKRYRSATRLVCAYTDLSFPPPSCFSIPLCLPSWVWARRPWVVPILLYVLGCDFLCWLHTHTHTHTHTHIHTPLLQSFRSLWESLPYQKYSFLFSASFCDLLFVLLLYFTGMSEWIRGKWTWCLLSWARCFFYIINKILLIALYIFLWENCKHPQK
jgi:hypothetical protein